MINFPVTICTAQLQVRSLFSFISLIKFPNLNLAGLPEYFTTHHCSPNLNLKPKSFTRQFTAHTVLLALAGAAGEQTDDHGGCKSGEADHHQVTQNPPASSQQQHPGVQALTSLRVLRLTSSSE
jgi:hypothetical protein